MKLVGAYYRLRRRLGMAEISPERLRRQEILHPETDAMSALKSEDEKRLRLGAACLAAGLLLTGIYRALPRETQLTALARPGYGEEAEEQTLHARLGQESYEVPLTLEGRTYTQSEWESLREEIWQGLLAHALGDNPDWEHVRTDLHLQEETDVPGIEVSWESSEPEWIDTDGTVGELTEEQDGAEVILTAVIQCEEESYEPQVKATLRTTELTAAERTSRALARRLAELAKNRELPEIALPEEFMGRPLRFLERDTTPAELFLLMGLLGAAALWFLPEQRRREAEKKRKKELEDAYPELISTLTVLLSAGLTIRGAWERMVMNYRRSLLAGERKHPLYEEMSLTLNSLGQGTLEEEAYVRFGKRCGLKPYLRLGSLLESNLKKGGSGLLPMLREDAEQALEQRLRDARKQGEEMSSKLLLPMLLLFSLVLVILMVPAFLTF